MATIKCTKCRSTLILPTGMDTITCGFCSTTLTVTDAKGSENQDSETVRLNKHYEQLLQKAKTYRDIKILTETAEEFDRLGEYENSRAMAEYCRKRADEEQAKRNEEMEKRKIEAQWKRKGQRWYNIRMVLIGILIVALVIAITLFMNEYLSDKTWLLP